MANIIKGQNFRVFLGNNVIAEAVSCSVEIRGETTDSSTKDTGGMFQKNMLVSKSWSVTVDTVQSSKTQIRTLISTIVSMTVVTLKWTQTTGENNSTAVSPAPSFTRTGNAYLTDFKLSAPNRDKVQISLQFQGTGGLS